jgi:hypothetical protein
VQSALSQLNQLIDCPQVRQGGRQPLLEAAGIEPAAWNSQKAAALAQRLAVRQVAWPRAQESPSVPPRDPQVHWTLQQMASELTLAALETVPLKAQA